jgi:hypothetical protein
MYEGPFHPSTCTGNRSRDSTSSATRALGRDTHRHARDAQQVAVRVLDRGRRCVDDRLRQHPFSQVIHALEASPRMRGDLPGPEQPLKRNLAFAPAPPTALATVASADLRHAERAAIANFREHLATEVGAVAPEAPDIAPGTVAVLRTLHAPAQQRLALDRQQ